MDDEMAVLAAVSIPSARHEPHDAPHAPRGVILVSSGSMMSMKRNVVW
jgi:hypothetical protein